MPRPTLRRLRPLARTGVSGRGRRWTAAAVVIAVLLLPLLPDGPLHLGVRPPAELSGRSPIGVGTFPGAARFEVFGTLRGIDPSGAPGPFLSGVPVELLGRPCTGYDACPFVTATTTNASTGNFSLAVPPGRYLLVTNRTGSFGGTDTALDLTGAVGGPYGPLALSAEPFEPYGNTTFVLPRWNPLAAYAANCNAQLPCPVSSGAAPPYGAQQPILSWTADGVFYVDAAEELVFYSFANQSLRVLAPWEPLYTNLMQYEGIENTEFLTTDGTYVYEFGCPIVCNATSAVEFYAVNTSTGRSFGTTLAGVDAGNFSRNGQVDLIGESGNLSIAAFVDADGVVLGYDLWNATQWVLGTLPYFEANNLYWVPLWGAYLDVRSEGISPESIYQVQLTGPSPGTSLVVVANCTTAVPLRVNGVNGVVYNLSAQTLDFTSQNQTGSAITFEASLGAGGRLEGLTPLWGGSTSRFGAWPNTSAYPNVAASEHRPTILVDGPAFAGYTDGWFENGSAFVDPGTGVWTTTNVSLDHLEGLNRSFRQSGPSPAAMEGLFYNTSYALLPASYDCRTNRSECPIQGNVTPSTPSGTVWWSWKLGAPEFPFPASAPLGEAAPPEAPAGLRVEVGGRTAEVTWNASTTPSAELLGYEVTYGPSDGGPFRSTWVPGASTDAEIGPLAAGTEYVVEVSAWNLHGHSAWLLGTGPTVTPAGWLNLTATPLGANVSLDQIPLARSGEFTSVPLAAGRYWVNVTEPGYTPFTAIVEITGGVGTALSADLIGIPPLLRGWVTPVTASVQIDGTPIPVSPPNGSFVTHLVPGTYDLSAAAPGYFPLGPDRVTLQYGQVDDVHLTLNRSYGWLVGTWSPSNASVTLDGVPVNATGGSLLLRLATGPYWINLTDPGRVPQHLGPLNVTALNTTNFTAVLVPYSGTLLLHVVPSNASVRLDDEPLAMNFGTAEVVVPAGPHALDVEAPGYETLQSVAHVPANGTVVLDLGLNRTVGWIRGEVRPVDARIALDGQPAPVSATGAFNLTAPPGPHRISLAAPGYRSIAENVTVLANATVWTNLTLVGIGTPSTAPIVPVGAVPILLGIGAAGIAVATGIGLYRGHRGRRRAP